MEHINSINTIALLKKEMVKYVATQGKVQHYAESEGKYNDVDVCYKFLNMVKKGSQEE